MLNDSNRVAYASMVRVAVTSVKLEACFCLQPRNVFQMSTRRELAYITLLPHMYLSAAGMRLVSMKIKAPRARLHSPGTATHAIERAFAKENDVDS